MASAAGKRKRKTTSRFQDTGAAPAPTKKMAAEAGGSDDVTTGGAETTGTLPYRVNPEFIIELLHTPCEMLKPPDNRVFIAERTDKVVDVFKGLVQHNFLAVPVLQKTKHLWYGFLDMADIVSYIVEHFEETQLSSSEDFWNLVNTTEEFQQKTVNEIMRRIGLTRNPFHPVKRGHSLLFVMEALAREHLHRVPVVDENRNLVNLITQSQLVRFLHQNLDRIGPKVDKPVAEMEGVFHEVVSIQHDQKALEAFKLMVKEKLTGIAVLNGEGKLIGNLSMRDLKAMATDGRLFWRLYQHVGAYIDKVKSEDTAHTSPRTVQTCTVNSRLRDVITQLAEHNIHRVYIVNDEHKPIGVIALKEILSEMLV